MLVDSHSAHREVVAWAGGRELHLSGHALAETYSVLTRLPGDARVAPLDAVELIEENFAEPLSFSTQTVNQVHKMLAVSGIAGGAVYDGLVALAAQENGLPLATRDQRARSTYEVLGLTVVTTRH